MPAGGDDVVRASDPQSHSPECVMRSRCQALPSPDVVPNEALSLGFVEFDGVPLLIIMTLRKEFAET